MRGIEALIEGGLVTENVPLGPLTTYKSGGPARFFAEVSSLADLERLAGSGVAEEIPVLVVGRGSNLVVSDSGFDGLVLHLGPAMGEIDIEGTTVVAGGAAPLAHVARSAVATGLVGLEFFVGIPGSVGGAVRQNAGCFGAETRDRLIEATVVDLLAGVTSAETPDQLDMSYRHSNLTPTQVVVSGRFQARPGDREVGVAEMRRITRWRRDNQPGGTLNAGSVFKNPPGTTAGEIIDALGLKGMSVGGVAVSSKHANFFVAGPDATSSDILALVEAVKDRVLAETGANLEPEIQFVGFEDEH
jgi:UDP-N-acetylmuramate dehydrogenase